MIIPPGEVRQAARSKRPPRAAFTPTRLAGPPPRRRGARMGARAHASRRAKRAAAAAQLPRIAIVNRSTVMKDAAVEKIAAALQTQVDRDFAPIWGAGAQLQFVGRKQGAPEAAWWLTLPAGSR